MCGHLSLFDGGEVFLRRRPRSADSPLDIPVQVQVIESEFCPMFDADVWPGLPLGNKIKQGIERNRFGARTAYWFYREHPGDGAVTPARDQLVRVAASQVAHVYEVKRPGQLRGVLPIGVWSTSSTRSIGMKPLMPVQPVSGGNCPAASASRPALLTLVKCASLARSAFENVSMPTRCAPS